jgi:release factor glutamine methyltransferase
LYAHCEQNLSTQQVKHFSKLLKRRLAYEPITYILGHKEFYSIDLQVNKNVLIPRPETELLVELVLAKFRSQAKINLADLGTGSGAIALAIANERPHWQIFATDKSAKALTVAKNNAQRLGIQNIKFHKGNWCHALPTHNLNVIVSNPPYICKYDPCLQKITQFEPALALTTNDAGLQHIKTIIKQAKSFLTTKGILILEHGFDHGNKIRQLMEDQKYTNIETHQDLSGNERATVGVK